RRLLGAAGRSEFRTAELLLSRASLLSDRPSLRDLSRWSCRQSDRQTAAGSTGCDALHALDGRSAENAVVPVRLVEIERARRLRLVLGKHRTAIHTRCKKHFSGSVNDAAGGGNRAARVCQQAADRYLTDVDRARTQPAFQSRRAEQSGRHAQAVGCPDRAVARNA